MDTNRIFKENERENNQSTMLATVSHVEFLNRTFSIVISPFVISGLTIYWPFSDFMAFVFCINDLEEIKGSISTRVFIFSFIWTLTFFERAHKPVSPGPGPVTTLRAAIIQLEQRISYLQIFVPMSLV